MDSFYFYKIMITEIFNKKTFNIKFLIFYLMNILSYQKFFINYFFLIKKFRKISVNKIKIFKKKSLVYKMMIY